jgi:integrase
MKTKGRYGEGLVFKRGARWWARYYCRGREYRESLGKDVVTRKQALTKLRERLGQAERGKLTQARDAEKLTLRDILAGVVRDLELNQRRTVRDTKNRIKHLEGFFGPNARALDIGAADVKAYIQHRRGEEAAPATIRAEVGILGRAFNIAAHEERLPARPPRWLPSIRVSNVRTGFLSDADVAALLPHLPPYLRAFVEAAYITGWRRSELCALRWAQVDQETGELRLDRGTTKSGEPRSFPFAAHPRLAALLAEQREQAQALMRATGRLPEFVFSHADGRPIRGWYYNAWRTACERAGLAGRLIHDLRRSCVRNLVRAGVSERVAMSLSGHLTHSVFSRYNIVAGSDQVEAVKKLAAMQGQAPVEPRKVVAIGETRTEPAQNGGLGARSRTQPIATTRAVWRPQRDSNSCYRRERAVS